MNNENGSVTSENKIKTFRNFFYISSLQLLAYFIVPMFLFPGKYILHIEFISAMTLGLAVGLFFLLVNIAGLVIDIGRRRLYIGMMILIGLWFLWAFVSLMYIEYMTYILR